MHTDKTYDSADVSPALQLTFHKLKTVLQADKAAKRKQSKTIRSLMASVCLESLTTMVWLFASNIWSLIAKCAIQKWVMEELNARPDMGHCSMPIVLVISISDTKGYMTLTSRINIYS